ncbi:MAG: radical SAM protein [Spirochaetaceae bacterium]|jgi:threonylcarbamoyladenosine tRNA methylthiotransferase MtaB|nr:radical SAM protein [Spirochaetaceae bacterium]
MPGSLSPPIARLVTIGCRLNQLETEGMARKYADAGFQICMEGGPGDAAHTSVCVVNTCTVTSKAEQKTRRIIRALLREYPHAEVLVTGCYAVLDSDALCAMDPRIRIVPKAALTPAAPPTSFFAHSRPSVKIQDGCDMHCTYCRIRLARGAALSLGAEAVVEQVRRLEDAGHREVTLTGVNLGGYRGDLAGRAVGLTELLALILLRTEHIAVRLSSLHPTVIDGDFCAVVSHPRVRPHFHLSVQSGSDPILRAMGRPYDATRAKDAVDLLRAAKPAPFIACDMITGFPGETEADFENTLALCRACAFAWIHGFPFSPRPGTAAAAMKPAIPQSIAGRRVRSLTELAVTGKIAYIESFAGKELSAVIERGTSAERVRGVTANFIHLELPAAEIPVELRFGAADRPAPEIPVRIIAPLEKNIRGGDEVEAMAKSIFSRKAT